MRISRVLSACNMPLCVQPVFESVSLHSLAPAMTAREPHVLRDSRAGHHTRAHCLLGVAELRGRLLLAAWEHGLGAATEGVVKLLHHATKVLRVVCHNLMHHATNVQGVVCQKFMYYATKVQGVACHKLLHCATKMQDVVCHNLLHYAT